jgi:predicted transcriptional regulator of viral defense system
VHNLGMERDLPSAVRKIADKQSGVVSRRQALKAGMSRNSIHSKVKYGKLLAIYPGVYTVFSGPLPREAQLWAAVLAAGQGAVLSHETAAEIWEMTDEPSQTIHVTVPKRRSPSSVPGIVVHRSDRVLGFRFAQGRLPVTWSNETVLDLVEQAEDFDTVCHWVTKGFVKAGVNDYTMRRAIEKRMKLRWRAELNDLVAEVSDGTQSPLEFRYDRDVERAHGLPNASRQVPYARSSGSHGYRDRYYEGYGVVVELDGNLAHPAEYRWRDIERDNAAAANDNNQSLRYGWRNVRGAPCATALQVARVLRNRGWTDAPRPCSTGCVIADSTF